MTKKVLMTDDDNQSFKGMPCGYQLTGKLSKRNLQLRLHKKSCEVCRTEREGITAEIPKYHLPKRTSEDGLKGHMRGDNKRAVVYSVKDGLIGFNEGDVVPYADIIDDEVEKSKNEFSYLRKKLVAMMEVGHFDFRQMSPEDRPRFRGFVLDGLQKTKEQLEFTKDPAEREELREYARVLIRLDIECKQVMSKC